MKRKVSGWICLVSAMLYASELVIPAVYAQGPGGSSSGGESVGKASGGGGENVAMQQTAPKKQDNTWKWVAGGLGAALLVLGGFVVADQANGDKSDAEKAASDAQKAADDAKKSADAAAAPAAPTAPASTTPTDPVPVLNNGFAYAVYLTGTFTGTETHFPSTSTSNFIPSITFTVPLTAGSPGGVSEYTQSLDNKTSSLGGTYVQNSDNSVFINVNDGKYLGTAVVLDRTKIKLATGQVLTASSGASAYLLKVQQ